MRSPTAGTHSACSWQRVWDFLELLVKDMEAAAGEGTIPRPLGTSGQHARRIIASGTGSARYTRCALPTTPTYLPGVRGEKRNLSSYREAIMGSIMSIAKLSLTALLNLKTIITKT